MPVVENSSLSEDLPRLRKKETNNRARATERRRSKAMDRRFGAVLYIVRRLG